MTDRSWTPAPQPEGRGTAVGAYTPAVRVGSLLFTSGQVPLNPETGLVETDAPFADQVRRTLANVRRVLEAAGADLSDVASVTVYLADIGDWAEFNEVYQEVFSPPYPARAVVGAALGGFKVEITAIAALPPAAAQEADRS
ncbi:MAG: Rid family detoxifying hydrolase [Gemmatimonadota bacterium]